MALTGRRAARVLPWALLLGLAATAGVRPAEAMGCHEAERPVASLAFLIDAHHGPARLEATPDPARDPSRVATPPCEDDMPRAPSRSVAPQPSTADLAAIVRPPCSEIGRIPASSQRATPRHAPSRVDRPPRPAAPAVGSLA